MKPSRLQQALAGLAVLFVVVVTVAGGLLLALSDNPAGLGASRNPTSTPYLLPTLPNEDALTPIEEAASSTPRPTATPRSPTTTPRSPTATATERPTATPRAASSDTPQRAQSCSTESGWVKYTVRVGDTLSEIGTRYGVSTVTLMEGNCRTSTLLEAGETLYVPNVAPQRVYTPTRVAMATTAFSLTPTTGPTPTNTTTDGLCTNANARITLPAPGSLLSGVVTFYGSATDANFSFYKLEFREYNSTRLDFVTMFTAYEPVENGILAEYDTRPLPNGMLWIRLVVVDEIGNYPEPCSILYRVTN